MVYLVIAGAVFVTDLFLKNRIEKSYKLGETEEICKGRILLTKYYNRGAALNFLEKRPQMMTVIHSGMVGFLSGVFAVLAGKGKNPGLLTGLAMMLGGGANNLYDRIKKKHVVDYFSFPVKWKWLRKIVFNLSDMFIFVGGLLVAIFARKSE